MKLTSEPKPVRIRIVSGGEEHSSLDSLRRNFCLPDLQKIEKQLIQWLNRQGNEGIEIAERLNDFEIFSTANSIQDYFEIYRLFFTKEIVDNEISSLFQLLEKWYNTSERNKNASSLIKLAFQKDDDITLFCYKHNVSGLTNDWVNTLKRIDREDAREIVNSIRVKIKYGIKNLEQAIKWVNYFWINKKPLENHHAFDPYTEPDIMIFVRNCLYLSKDHEDFGMAKWRFFPNLKEYHFNSKEQYFTEKRKDFLFDAKLFILMLYYKEENATKFNMNLWSIEQSKGYLPAKYLRSNSVHIESFDNEAFKYKTVWEQIELFVTKHLFEF